MPSKSTSKSATASTAKSPKPSKTKAPISSEYVDDSDGDSDEQMTDAPPKKSTPKSSEKTSRKRNRDGTEKVNGAGKTGSKATTSAATNGSVKKSKKIVEVVQESSEEESESASSEEESSSAEESESETSEPAKSSKSKTTTASFKLPLDRDVPAGYTPLDSTASESIPPLLQGKEIFLFKAPSNFSFSDVKKIRLQTGPEGETLEAGDNEFIIRRSQEPVSSSMKVVLPREGKKGYQLASVVPTVQFAITPAPPSARSKKATAKALPPPPRAQPGGLRMRFMPAGYGEESDLNVNEAVLPRKDLVTAGNDGDIVMDDTNPTPKKSKKSEDDSAELPKEKKKKKKSKAPVDEDEEVPEAAEPEKKKSKKEKKEKSKDEDGKKEKKKKHKKDKAEA
ncbi:hypothetical protein H072_7048 [Dactylellina haptotyla CBS 200.50]|uniref:Uncharacterized protein n=1 Tax=Dactylellina haptotyla (strain CBS 200.50) TaxID=1284197 RepID=S8BIN7_DACHA|nr:hypothetical protein H072_7048 [Dactylellina haptotyla CBS 200.50]